jgi:two-component system, sensor histidine kinase and response regulator
MNRTDDDSFVLIVDDNTENLRVVSNFLKEKNYKIALATDGPSAIKITEETEIDLILLDIMMPGMDGFETCEILKKNPSSKDIPIIFLTGRDNTEDIVKGFQVGGVDYITKPFRKEELFMRVKTHIQLKLLRDCLVKSELDTRKSRDDYMKILYGLAKIIDRNK